MIQFTAYLFSILALIACKEDAQLPGQKNFTQPTSPTATSTVSLTTTPPISASVGSSTTNTVNHFAISYEDSVYNGDYPIKNGVPITTYSYALKDTIYFNNHIWNHWPAFLGSINLFPTNDYVGCLLFAGGGKGDDGRESFSFRAPAKIGLYKTKDLIYPVGSIGLPFFLTLDSDVTTNTYQLDEQAESLVEVTHFDPQNRHITGRFSFHFKLAAPKKLSVGVVYPTTIHMHGSFRL